MSKLKQPIISLEAHGTLAGSLTFKRRRGKDLVVRKPIPTYRRTLPQQYQRWDYQDGIAYWATLTPAEKQIYQSGGAKHHMTGFAYFMSYYLSKLPDLAGRWRFDEGTGAAAYDSSKNTNTGTIFGALWAGGIIDGGLFFDGIDDVVSFGTDPSLMSITQGLTIIAWVHLLTLDRYHGVLSSGQDAATWVDCPWTFRVTFLNTIALSLNDDTLSLWGIQSLEKDRWYRIATTYDRQFMRLYIDGIEDNSTPRNVAINPGIWPVRCAEYRNDFNLHGYIDDVILASRAFSPEQIKQDAERRYP